MKLIPRKPINADDNLGRGMDMALVTLVFLGIGWAIDRRLDTKPLFMIGLVLVALVGQFVKMWYAYDATMARHEDERRAAAQAAPRAQARSTESPAA